MQIEAVKPEIDPQPDLQQPRDLIASLKGVGNLTAAKRLAEIRNLAAFDPPQQWVAFASLNPRPQRAGSSVPGQSRSANGGCAAIRAARYRPAVSAKNTLPALQPLVQRLEQRGHGQLGMGVAVMRKRLHLIVGILKSGQPFDPRYGEKRAAAP